MAIDKISSYDAGYLVGDLSVFPNAIDSFSTLYEARNESRTKLKAAISYTASTIVVEDTSSFPDKGILRLYLQNAAGFDTEFVYYDQKTTNTFTNLKRGFCATRQNSWPIDTVVESGVFAEHHNSLKDAVIQIENFVGFTGDKVLPITTNPSLSAILNQVENRFLSPVPIYRAYPLRGLPPLTVTFQNFSSSNNTRFFWDFGDGGTSYEKNPVHTYVREGHFNVQLRVINSNGGQGVTNKKNYISISYDDIIPFSYITPLVGYSTKNSSLPTKFTFIDQTQGKIISRLWQFGDGDSALIEDPDIHTAEHYYKTPGKYQPTLTLTYEGNKINRAIQSLDSIEVL
jgi:PKD repeat protein